MNKRFAKISHVPERRAYLCQPVGLVSTFLSVLVEKIIDTSNTPILAPNNAGRISLVSIRVIINEKPEKRMAAEAVRKNT
jgi:hypothetical protein